MLAEVGIDYARRGVAEFIGTFALIFIGATASIYNDQTVAAFGNGLVIAVMVSAFAGISGGHFNPAVTMGFFVTRRISVSHAFFYWFVQSARPPSRRCSSGGSSRARSRRPTTALRASMP
jgi:glycerol uptake facilitator-like aquaporin